MALKNCENKFPVIAAHSDAALDSCFFSPTQAEQMQDKAKPRC
jgi:hypothetical protein